ncbi:MAG: polymer-forming cytoskeletal protein [Lachnospiraceae bacterium]|nr:polymer-forming cytoskeletal protein [Lachnospiraceae bacterium]
MLFNEDKVRIKVSAISTVISEDTVVNGSIESETAIRVDGKVNGNITTREPVVISKNAEVRGDIRAESIIVAGVVQGNLTIDNKTNIEPTGELYGDIETDRLLIDEESVFFGNCIMKRENKAMLSHINKKKTEVARKNAEELVRKKSSDENTDRGTGSPDERTEPVSKEPRPVSKAQEMGDDSDEGIAYLNVSGQGKRKKYRKKR